MCLVGKVEP